MFFMKKINFALLGFLLFLQIGFVRAQDDSEVVKINTSVIQVDATVTDKSGKVVTDLKPEDFEIYENGKKRDITGFSLIIPGGKSGGIANGFLLTSSNSSSAAVAPAPTAAQVGRIFAVVVDDLTLSKVGVEASKREIARFIEQQVVPGDLVAVVKTSGSVGVLQKFTSDKTQLLKSVEEIKFHPLTSIGTTRFAPVGISFSDQIIGNIAADGSINTSSVVANRTDIEAAANSFRSRTNALGALQVLRNTIDALGYLKGKKTLLYVSEGTNLSFSLENENALNSINDNEITLANQNALKIGDRNFSINNYLQAITESANRNSVSIFPIDPSGAATTNLGADEATHAGMFNSMSRAQIDAVTTGRNTDIRGAQDTLKYLARETGGKAFINKNEYGKEIKDVLDAQNGYYLLAYEPDETTFNAKDSRFNKIEIKVKRPNVNVVYRSGFFNVSTGSKQNPSAAGDAILQRLFVPYNYTDINVEVTSIYAGTEKDVATVRSFVNITPGDLTVSDNANGKKNAKFDLVAAVFNEQGVAVGSSAKSYELLFDPKSYEDFLKSGVVSNLTFNIQKAGNYRIKILVKDSVSGKIGTTSQMILVPDAEKQSISFSGFLLQNYTAAQWQAFQKNPAAAANAQKMQIDTAFRHFKKGTVLTFNYALNLAPQLSRGGDAKVVLTTKLIKAGQVLLSFTPEEVAVAASGQRANRRGAFNLGTQMQAGKYTLQVTAETDKTRQTETQSVDFEVVE